MDAKRDSTASRLLAAARRGLPPVERWNPPLLGDLDMCIHRDGSWSYRGGAIQRTSMVRLFSTILRREEDGSYVLVTPTERWRIRVEDAPFVAVDVDVHNPGPDQRLEFATNAGDRVVADSGHPIFLGAAAERGAPPPYIRVRGGLDARIGRACYHHMAAWLEVGERDGALWHGVRSAGAFFALAPAGGEV